MNISAFFPAYNEEGNIRYLIAEAEKVLTRLTDKHEIIVVLYEGSSDKTKSIVQNIMKKNKNVKLVMQPKKQKGYGVALRLGYKAAKYDWVFYTDSDNQYDLELDLPMFVSYSRDYKFVTGHRKKRQDPMVRKIAAGIYNLTMKIVFFIGVRDVDCAFKLVHKDVLKAIKLKSKSGIVDTELLVKAKKAGFEIKQLPITHLKRLHGGSAFETATGLPKMSTITGLIKELWKLVKEVYF